MRGSTAKVLRAASRAKYRQMVEQKRINPPESPEHYRYQLRKLYQAGKKAFTNLPHDVKGRFATHYRKSRIARLDYAQSLRDSASREPNSAKS